MAQFDRYTDFTFNGFNFAGLYMICTKGSSDLTSQFGNSRSVVEDEGVGDIPVFYGIKNECPTPEFSITKVRNGNIAPFTDDDLKELTRLLFKNTHKPLLINGLVYYGIFTKGSNWRVGSGEGIITLNFKLASPYAFSPIMLTPVQVIGSKTFDVYNKSTNDDLIYPDIEFQLQGESAAITITNMTTGQVVEFNGLDKGEWVYVYNDGVKQIQSKIDNKKNLFGLFNKEWLKLVYGRNVLKVDCEKCKINVIYQNKIQLY